MAFPTGWGRKCALVIQASKVAGSGSHSNFPVLLTKDTLPLEMFDHDGSYPALEGGGDIRFSSDSDGNTRLPCEIVDFSLDDANDRAEIYVNVSSVSTSSDTTIYIWYNKSGESQPGESEPYGRHATWNSNYKAVWHLNESSGMRYDSTENNNDLDDNNTVASGAGKVGSACAHFVSSNSEYLSISDANQTGLDLNHDYTIIFWINLDSYSVNAQAVISKGLYSSEGFYGTVYTWRSGDQKLGTRHNDGTNNAEVGSDWGDPDLDDGNWYFWSIQYEDLANEIIFGLDASDFDIKTMDCTPGDNAQDVRVGAYASNYVSGMFDEFRVSNTKRTAGWIETEYNNTNDPATFTIEGTPETPSSGEALLKIISETAQLVETKLNPRTMRRVINETINLVENIVKKLTGQALIKIIDEIVNIYEIRKIPKIINETLQVVESKLNIRGLVRILSESISFIESVIYQKGMKKIIDEAIQLMEGRLRAIQFRRIVSETLQAIESSLPAKAMKRIINETINLVESIVRRLGLKRIINESLSIAENIVKKLTYMGGQLIKVISEAVQLVETRLRIITLRRIINETVQFVEDKIKTLTMRRIINETINLIETRLRVINLRRIINETAQLIESNLNPKIMKRIVNETVNLIENIIKYFSGQLVKVINESLSLIETKLRIFNYRRIINESLQLVESKIRLSGLKRWINETVQTIESRLKIMGFTRIISEALNLQEGIIRVRKLIRLIAENLFLQEGTIPNRAMKRIVNEGINIAESIAKYLGLAIQFVGKLLKAWLERKIEIKAYLERDLGAKAYLERSLDIKAILRVIPKE